MLLLALLACKGSTAPDSAAPELGEPALVVTPDALAFGAVTLHTAAEEALQLQNQGDGDLHLMGFTLEPADAPFVYGPPSSAWVPPGESVSLPVRFEPAARGPAVAALTILSDDPQAPALEVQLGGTGGVDDTRLTLNPPNADLGEVYIGCTSTLPLTLRNTGAEPVVIEELEAEADGEGWALDLLVREQGELPWTLEVGQSKQLQTSFSPTTEAGSAHTLQVHAGAASLVDIQLGEGAALGENTDVYEVGHVEAVDVLIALDASASMDDDVAGVVANLERFVASIDDWGADTRLALTTADDGCVAGPRAYMDQQMSDDERLDALAEMLAGERGGAYAERGFERISRALSATNTGSGGCNEGLLREEAALSLLVISDDGDRSGNGYAYWVSYLQSLKGDAAQVKLSAVSGDYPQGCGTADAGSGYYEASVATGGLYLSICAEDYSAQLSALEAVDDHSDGVFPLSDAPWPPSLNMWVDGAAQEAGWTFDAGRQEVAFDAPPSPGAIVVIDYILQPECG